jgi:meso-butanediol dehydrogenase/(S,S)-butanediol dehydrogenase/diacetyl reductase
MQMSTTNGDVAIVTGGGTGIGAAITRCLARAGSRVLISGRREAPLKALCADLPACVSYVTADVTREEARRSIIEIALARYGKIDALINNAGIAPMGAFVNSTDQDFETAYRTNLVAPAALIRAAVPHLTTTSGAVVNISTAAARAVLPGLSAYLTSKAALSHLTRLLALELGPLGIRVNAVAPGATRTDLVDELIATHGEANLVAMTPLGRIGVPADIAETVCFLASRKSAWVTGQIVEVTGGMLL